MSVSHTNRRGQTYYLHESTARGGRSTFFFSMKCEGTLADKVPEGFEIAHQRLTRIRWAPIKAALTAADYISNQ